ncbi:MAG: hypothetical protein AAGN66_09035 [Acidobacteriota bacterium]
MSSPLRGLPRHNAYLRWLKIGLVAGAIYDFVFAALMLLAPELPERLLGLRPPGDAYFLWLNAVFLTMLGCFYLYAAYDPLTYRGNVVVAIVGRFAGFVAMAWAAYSDPSLKGLYPLAFGDLFFSVAHGVCWWPLRR